MRKLIFGSLLFCYSCSGERDTIPVPGNLIPTEKMIPIIVDLQILESHFQRTFNRPDLYKESLDSSSTLIFKNHGVTKTQFDSSYTYYASDVQVIYKIYESALDSLTIGVLENDI